MELNEGRVLGLTGWLLHFSNYLKRSSLIYVIHESHLASHCSEDEFLF